MRQSTLRVFSLAAAAFLVVSMLLTFSCGQKRKDDSAELALISYLIAIGVLRPSAITRPSAEGDPANAQANENCTEGCSSLDLVAP